MQIKRLLVAVMVALAFLAVLPLSGVWADDPPQPTPEEAPLNLLTNPGMEGQFAKQCSLRNGPHWVRVPCPQDYSAEAGTYIQWETTQVPDGWSAWWRQPNNNYDDPNYFNTYPHACPNWETTPRDCMPWHNPEYRDTLGGPRGTGPVRKVAGDNSQKYFTFYSLHEAGLYQVVSGVKPGDRLRFTIFLEAWSTSGNDPERSDLNQRMNLQVGIDPTGGNNPWSPGIIWTEPAESFDRFTQFAVEAVAKNNVVSVWTRSRPVYALQHVDVYADEASLTVVQPAKPAKAPVKATRVVTSTKIITSTRLMTDTNGVVSRVVITQSVLVTQTVPATTAKPVTTGGVVTSTKIVTSTRLVTGTNGVVSRVVVTQSVIVTTTRPVTSTASTKPVTSTTSTKPVTATSAAKPVTATTATNPMSGSPAIPASGTYMVVKGDTLIAIARRFGITPWLRLAELNKLKEPYTIEVGQVLKLR